MKLPLKVSKLVYRDYFGTGFKVFKRLACNWLLNYKNYVDRKVILRRPFEAEQLSWFSDEITRRGCTTFLDVGANFGLYSVYLLRHCQSLQQAYAVEPQARNFNQLCANVLLNDLSGKVKPLCWGASNARKSVEFLENKGSSTGTSRIAETAPAGTRHDKYETVALEVDALDNLLPPLTDSIMAIKIDVEGHEMAVLEGAKGLLQNNACLLQIEVLGDDSARLEQLASRFGLVEIHRIDCDVYFCNEAMLKR